MVAVELIEHVVLQALSLPPLNTALLMELVLQARSPPMNVAEWPDEAVPVRPLPDEAAV